MIERRIVVVRTTERWLRITLAIAVMISIVFIGFVTPANSAGAKQISGIGYFAEDGECVDEAGMGAAFALKLTGDLEGCHYVFVETATCLPSGTYRETGTEIYVGSGSEGDDGMFHTTYQFEAKYKDCSTGLVEEIHGRCQHPIVAGTGTGDYEGVTGRLDFKDDIDAGNFPYRGHLRWQ
jgi:hypothetical protein